MSGRLFFLTFLKSGEKFLAGVLLLFICVQAQTGGVKGKVLDRETLQPLAAANVIIENTHFGFQSNLKGEFSLSNIPAGRYTISASRVGYSLRKYKIEIEEEKIKEIEFLLTPYILPGEEVVITATRASHDMPVTSSNISKQNLEENYIAQDVPELLSKLPSTTFYSENGNGIGYNYVNIRGFDQRRIAVMINGVPQNDPEDHNVYWLDFPDLMSSTQDIQVQRGAGSAFYGPPAIGGSVNIITEQFSENRNISLQTASGSYNTRKYGISYGSGILDNKYSFNGRFSTIKSDGYRQNAWVDFNSYYLNVSRFDKDFTTQVNIYGGPIADGLAYNGLPRYFKNDKQNRKLNWSYFSLDPTKKVDYYTERRSQEIENFSQSHYEMINQWKINDQLNFNSTLFYVVGEGFFDYDGSWINSYGSDIVRQYFRMTAQNGFDTTATVPSNTLIRAWVGNKQGGWLPRLDWKKGQHDISLGGEFRIHRSLHWGKIQWAESLPSNFNPDYRFYQYRGGKDIASVYFHDFWKIHPAWNLMTDLQMIYNRYRIYDEKYVGTDFKVPYFFANPRLGVSYQPGGNWTGYANISYTSREPRLINLYDAASSSVPDLYSSDFGGKAQPLFKETSPGIYDFSNPLVKPEKLLNVELGGGMNLENRLSINATVFWMDFRNEIIKKGLVDRFGQPVTTNAKRSRHQGIEISGSWKPISHFEIFGNGTLSQNRLIRYQSTQKDTAGFVNVKLNGNPIAGFPDQMGFLGLQYRWSSWSTSLTWKYVGSFYTDNFKIEDRKVPSYSVMNLITSYKCKNIFGLSEWEVKLMVNNLLNALYFASGEGNEFFPAAERNFILSMKFDL